MDKSLPIAIMVDQDTQLRLAHVKYAAPLFSLLQAEATYLHPWLPWLKLPDSLEATRRMIWEQQLFNQGGQRLTTFIQHRGELIGMLGFIKFDKKHHCGEMGYWLAEQHQGKGIMTHCCKKFIAFGFENLGLNRIELRITPDNKRSLQIPARLSFSHEGTLRQAIQQNGHFQDIKIFSLLKEEYNTKFLF